MEHEDTGQHRGFPELVGECFRIPLKDLLDQSTNRRPNLGNVADLRHLSVVRCQNLGPFPAPKPEMWLDKRGLSHISLAKTPTIWNFNLLENMLSIT